LAVEREVIAANLKKLKVKEFLSKELERADISEIEIKRKPMETDVIVHAKRPGIVIGKKGLTIKRLTEILIQEYGLHKPEIAVKDLKEPYLSAPVMAKSIASSLERGYHYRRAAYSALRNIMSAGAIGAEITISGKITGERSRMEKYVDGYIKHCGEPAERLVKVGFAEAAPKLGRIGVKVKILPPDARLPDDIKLVDEEPAPEPMQVEEEPEPVAEPQVEVEEEEEEQVEEQKDILAKPARAVLKELKGMSKEELSALLEEETLGKKRKTVIEGIKRLILQE